MNLREIAERAGELEEEIGADTDAVLNKAIQEFGKLNDAIQRYRGIYCRAQVTDLPGVKKGAGDLMLNIVSVLYQIGVDPNELPNYAAMALEKLEMTVEEYRENRE